MLLTLAVGVLVGCEQAPSPSAVASNSEGGALRVDLVTEAAARVPGAGCTTQGGVVVTLRVDVGDNGHGRVNVTTQDPQWPGGVPPVVWPHGFASETRDGRLVVLDERGAIVAVAGRPFVLAGGSVADNGYHVCLIDGKQYPGG